MKKLSILFVAPRFHTNQFFIIKNLAERGYKVNFYVVDKEFSEDYTYLNPIIIKPSLIYKLLKHIFSISINKDRKLLLPSMTFLFQTFKENRPDIIIVRNPHYVYSLIFILFGKLFNVKPLIYSQDPVFNDHINFRQKCVIILTHIFHVKWISPVKGDISLTKMTKNIFYVPLVIDKYETPLVRNQVGSFNILMVGKFLNWKNHLLLIKAIYELKKRGKDIILQIIGECSNKEHFTQLGNIKTFINENELKDNVLIETNIPYQEMDKYYKNADFFVLPSFSERFSISPLEALRFGLPVIVSNDNGFRFNIISGYNGFIFESNNLDDLVIKINFLLHREKINSMRNNCLEYVEKQHSPDIYIKSILSLTKFS